MNHNIYTVCLIGNPDTGKSSLLNAYLDLPLANEVTVFANIRSIRTYFKRGDLEKLIKLRIVDTAGQERYTSVMPSIIYREAHLGIIVFDLSEPSSLEGLDRRIRNFVDSAREEVILVLVGNKQDINTTRSELADRMINDRIKQLTHDHLITFYIQTSARTKHNVDLLFEQIACLLDSVYP